jgi:hypothetical protein
MQLNKLRRKNVISLNSQCFKLKLTCQSQDKDVVVSLSLERRVRVRHRRQKTSLNCSRNCLEVGTVGTTAETLSHETFHRKLGCFLRIENFGLLIQRSRFATKTMGETTETWRNVGQTKRRRSRRTLETIETLETLRSWSLSRSYKPEVYSMSLQWGSLTDKTTMEIRKVKESLKSLKRSKTLGEFNLRLKSLSFPFILFKYPRLISHTSKYVVSKYVVRCFYPMVCHTFTSGYKSFWEGFWYIQYSMSSNWDRAGKEVIKFSTHMLYLSCSRLFNIFSGLDLKLLRSRGEGEERDGRLCDEIGVETAETVVGANEVKSGTAHSKNGRKKDRKTVSRTLDIEIFGILIIDRLIRVGKVLALPIVICQFSVIRSLGFCLVSLSYYESLDFYNSFACPYLYMYSYFYSYCFMDNANFGETYVDYVSNFCFHSRSVCLYESIPIPLNVSLILCFPPIFYSHINKNDDFMQAYVDFASDSCSPDFSTFLQESEVHSLSIQIILIISSSEVCPKSITCSMKFFWHLKQTSDSFVCTISFMILSIKSVKTEYKNLALASCLNISRKDILLLNSFFFKNRILSVARTHTRTHTCTQIFPYRVRIKSKIFNVRDGFKIILHTENHTENHKWLKLLILMGG